MTHIFFAENGIAGLYLPVDTERFVEYRDSAIGFGSIIIVALILEHSLVAQHCKTMCEPAWHKKLQMILGRQLHSHMTSVGRRPHPHIHSHIEYTAHSTPHQLGLRERRPLKVQPAHHTTHRPALVVLHKVDLMAYRVIKFALGIAFKEISTRIGKDTRLQYQHTVYITSILSQDF